MKSRYICLVAGILCSIGASAQDIRKPMHIADIPYYFEENHGQETARARFIGHGPHSIALISAGEVTLSGAGKPVSMRIRGADPNAPLASEQPIKGVTNYYIAKRAIEGLSHFARVRARNVLPGIDVVYHSTGSSLEYDFAVHPGADPGMIRMRLMGGSKPVLADNGDVVIQSGGAQVRLRRPHVWEEEAGVRREVDSCYVLSGPREVRLKLASRNRWAELVIDPVLDYSTYLGGTGMDAIVGMAADNSGFLYVAGITSSPNFPITSGTSPTSGTHLFVSKLNAAGTGLVYSTIIAGSSQDIGGEMAIDSSGNAYVVGLTNSTDFPATIGHFTGTEDGFALKLGPTGTLVFSNALAGSGLEYADGVALDTANPPSIYVCGSSSSTDFPVTAGSYQTTLAAGGMGAFVVKLAPSGQITYGTFVGSAGAASQIAVDSLGQAVISGSVGLNTFPTTPGAYQTTYPGAPTSFVSKLNAAGSALIFSTYIGNVSGVAANGLALDPSADVYVSGTTNASNFPTTAGSFMPHYPSKTANYTTYLLKLNPTGTTLLASTFLGGSNQDIGGQITLDSNGSVYIVGTTYSSDFPTTSGALQTVPGPTQMFVSKLSGDLTTLQYSTFLGSTINTSSGSALALDGNGAVYLGGLAAGQTYPTTAGALLMSNPTPFGGNAPVISKIDLNSSVLCLPSVAPTSQSVPATGGSFGFNLTLAPGCPWNAAASDDFVSFTTTSHGVVSSSPIAIGGLVGSSPIPAATIHTVSFGTATFTVTQAPAPGLSLSVHHSSSFSPGQQNAMYSIEVSNLPGAGFTNGTVTVTDTLPGGLTLVSMSGNGWSCSSNTCSRSDSLLAGGSYPAITVTVNVVAIATSSVTNQVSVTGGGSASASVNDITVIGSLAGADVGVFRSSQWWLDGNGDFTWTGPPDRFLQYGEAGDVPIIGDWDNTGVRRIGVFRNGQWWLDINNDGVWDAEHDIVFYYGEAGDVPLIGDWDGTGVQRIGVFRSGQWWLDINNDHQWDAVHDIVFYYGESGDIPMVADWDNTGLQRVGVFRGGQWWLDMNNDHVWDAEHDQVFYYGEARDVPVIGDWTHSGQTRIGVFRQAQWWLDLNNDHVWDPVHDVAPFFGLPSDTPVVAQ